VKKYIGKKKKNREGREKRERSSGKKVSAGGLRGTRLREVKNWGGETKKRQENASDKLLRKKRISKGEKPRKKSLERSLNRATGIKKGWPKSKKKRVRQKNREKPSPPDGQKTKEEP